MCIYMCMNIIRHQDAIKNLTRNQSETLLSGRHTCSRVSSQGCASGERGDAAAAGRQQLRRADGQLRAETASAEAHALLAGHLHARAARETKASHGSVAASPRGVGSAAAWLQGGTAPD